MKGKLLFFLMVILLPKFGYAQGSCQPPTNLTGYSNANAVELSWDAPQMAGSLSGTVLVQDTFDTYTTGAYVAQQSVAAGFTHWMPSNGITGYPLDATVSTDHAFSGTKSMKCSNGSDMILNLGNQTTGHYLIDFYMYIPNGQYAEMHLFHIFDNNNVFQFGADIYLKNASYGTVLMVAQIPHAFTMNYNEWTKFRFDIDLDQNTASLYVGESITAVHTWTFTSQSMLSTLGTKQLAALEFKTSTNTTYYVDNVSFVEYAMYYNLYRNSQALVTDYQGTNYTDTNVVIGQEYSYYLTTKCDLTSESVPSGILNFTHGSSVLANIIVGEGTEFSNVTPFYNYYKHSWTEMVYDASEIGSGGSIRALSFNCSAGGTLTLDHVKVYMAHKIGPVYTSVSSWTTMDDLTLVYEQNNVTMPTTAGWFELLLQTPFEYNGTDNLVVVVSKTSTSYSGGIKWYYTSVDNTVLHRYSDGNSSCANHPGSNPGTFSSYRPNALFTMILSDQMCLRPDALSFSNVSNDGVSVSWGAANNTQWNLKYGPKDFILETEGTLVSGLSSPNYTITSLTPNTEYDVYVQTDCGEQNGVSGWRGPVAFTTVSCSAENMCPIYLELYDQVFDGWNGDAAINVYTNDVLLDSYTLHSGSNHVSYTIPLCPGSADFTWTAGMFDSDCSFVILDANHDTLFVCAEGDALTYAPDEVFFSFEHSCSTLTCSAPTNVEAAQNTTASGVLTLGITLTWSATADALSYNVYRDGEQVATGLTSTSYTETPSTSATYCFTVKAVCEEGESASSDQVCVDYDATVGIAENAAEQARIYPNPTINKVKVEAAEMTRIIVMNVIGQTIFEEKVDVDAYEFDFAGYEAGVYMIRIETTTGNATKRVTVVK